MPKSSVVSGAAEAALAVQPETCPAPAGRLANILKPMRAMLERYLQLAKPGIIMGNLVSTIGGFFLAAPRPFDPVLFFAALLGVALVIASGCIFNNYIDRDIDEKMRRTQNRVLVRGLVAPSSALVYGGLVGLSGFAVLYIKVNPLSALLALSGFAIYVGVYTAYFKRHSSLSTLIGSLAGAMPPVIGYCAVRGRIDLGSLLLLLIFGLWQIPHSYAIAILYRDDYAAAQVPVLPVRHGIETTKKHILFFIPLFMLATLSLPYYGYTGPCYLIVATGFGFLWLGAALRDYRKPDVRAWARKIFVLSIIGMMTLSLAMALRY